MNTYASVGQRTSAVASPKPKHITPDKPAKRMNHAGQPEPVSMKGIVNKGVFRKQS